MLQVGAYLCLYNLQVAYQFYQFCKTCENFVMTSDETEIPVQVSPKRWVVLISVFILTIMYVFTIFSFGPIDNITVAYFNITYAASDWIVLSTYLSSVVFFPIIAWYSYSERLNLKLLLLTCLVAILLNFIFNIAAFLKSNWFGMIVLGQFFVGFVQSSYCSFPGAVATMWFPEKHIGAVTGLITMSWNVGMLFSELLLENILKTPPSYNSSNNFANLSENFSNASVGDWCLEDRNLMLIVYFVLLICGLIIFITVLLLIPALPKHPPSLAQAAKRQNATPSVTFLQFFYEIKKLISNCVFIQIQIVMGLTIQTFVLETLIMQQLVGAANFSLLDIQKSTSKISGYVLACRSVGDMVGSVVGGKLLDTFHKYRLQTIIGSGLAFGAVLVLFASYYFASFVGLCLSMFLYGVCSYIGFTPLYDAVLQHTYPLNVILVSSIAGSLRFCATILISESARLLLHFTGPIGVLVFHCLLQLIGFVLSFFIKPKLKRSNQDPTFYDHNLRNTNESTPLLHD